MTFDGDVPELIVILVVVLLVFGPGKLPETGASLGEVLREFGSATEGLNREFQAATRLESEDEMRMRLIWEQQTKPQWHLR